MKRPSLYPHPARGGARLDTLGVFKKQRPAFNRVFDDVAQRSEQRLIRASDSFLQFASHVGVRPSAEVPHNASNKLSCRHAVFLSRPANSSAKQPPIDAIAANATLSLEQEWIRSVISMTFSLAFTKNTLSLHSHDLVFPAVVAAASFAIAGRAI